MSPIATAHGTTSSREGLILMVTDEQGVTGLGDAAPLPGFSRESLDDVQPVAQELVKQVDQHRTQLDIQSFDELRSREESIVAWAHNIPSLRFAFEAALADVAAQRAHVPVALWLNPEAGSRIPVNGLLGGTSADDLAQRARELSKAGTKTFKIKTGVSDDVTVDAQRVKSVHSAVPIAQLRVDVNGAWNGDQLRTFLAEIRDCPLDFIEQPMPPGCAADSHAICREFDTRMALDEEIASPDDALHFIKDGIGDALVLKPMMLGGLVPCMRIASQARRNGVQVIYTSAWESDIGVAATLHLALAAGPTSSCAGLSTAGMIGADFVDPPLRITKGYLSISNRAGLGLSLKNSPVGTKNA